MLIPFSREAITLTGEAALEPADVDAGAFSRGAITLTCEAALSRACIADADTFSREARVLTGEAALKPAMLRCSYIFSRSYNPYR